MIHHINVTQDLLNYVRLHSLRDNNIYAELRAKTYQLPERNMQILPELGQFLALLVKLTKAKRALEVGVFTGYSTLCIAEALPDDGVITACDINERWINIAVPYWQALNVGNKVDVKLGDALVTLDNLMQSGLANAYDFAFIDADKENYQNYYEKALHLVKPGGLVVLDNTLWSGKVTQLDVNDVETESLRQVNQLIFNDNRVDMVLLPFADGVTLALKK